MRLSILMAAAALCALLIPTGPSQAVESIFLEYDAQGRVKGLKRVETKGGGQEIGSRKFDPDTSFVEGELIVINPPRDFLDAIRLMDFSLIERVQLTEMNLEIQRLRIPADMKVPEARTFLRGLFPELTIDANHVFDPSLK